MLKSIMVNMVKHFGTYFKSFWLFSIFHNLLTIVQSIIFLNRYSSDIVKNKVFPSASILSFRLSNSVTTANP